MIRWGCKICYFWHVSITLISEHLFIESVEWYKNFTLTVQGAAALAVFTAGLLGCRKWGLSVANIHTVSVPNILCVSVPKRLAYRRLTAQGAEHTFPKYQASCPNFFLSILCSSHGMSYPISGLVKTYKPKDYNVDHSLVVKLDSFLRSYHTFQFLIISH